MSLKARVWRNEQSVIIDHRGVTFQRGITLQGPVFQNGVRPGVSLNQTKSATKPKIERVYRDRSNYLFTLDDKDLIERYRFPRHVIERLINDVQPLIMRPTYRAHAVPVHTQVHLHCYCQCMDIHFTINNLTLSN